MSAGTRKTRVETEAVAGVSPLLLGNCSHLENLATGDLVRLSEAAICRMAFEGETIYRQGDASDSVYLLLDGSVELRHRDESGATSAYEMVAPYATFGDLALLGEPRRRYTVTASRASVLLALPAALLIEVLQANPQAALAWRSAILARLHRKEPKLAPGFGWSILGKLQSIIEAA